eukprot:c24845_g1_i1 orf=374-6757(+)
MPLFISDVELQALGDNVAVIAERADVHIRDLLQQLEAHKARVDAAAIMAEQRGAVVEQKFLTMSSQFKHMESEKAQLEQTLGRRSVELAEVQAQVHKLELKSMEQDSDRERLSCELNEARKAKRELLEVIEQKNAEATEKNTYIKGYLDKIVFLSDERSILEGKLREAESELNRSQAVQARLLQEKELLEQHNSWLNEELTDKVDTLLKERRTSSDLEMELYSKLSRAEQACKEKEESLQRNKEQAKDLELRLSQAREELRSIKEEAASKEDHLSLEVETASKLAELYKESSEEWSKKAVDLEGVIKALEVHLNQVETDFKERLQKEIEGRKVSEKNALEAKEKMEKLGKELELLKNRKENDSLLLIDNFPEEVSRELTFSDQQLSLELHEDGVSLPIVSSGVSGTALAAALLRDGWSLTKVYVKYQEAVDAWRHERQERKQSQDLLQRVLQEIERRAELILEERADHARMAEAYAVMEEKLHLSVEEQSSLENQIRELKAELRKRERDLNGAKQECSDLQTEVAVLLKECADIKLRSGGERFQIQSTYERRELTLSGTASDAVVSERLLTFKDIHELVEQNNQLRAVVRSLGHQNEECETKLKEAFDLELKKRTDEATRKVSTIVKKSEEQMQLIASLQGTVGMYRRLYEEELKSRSTSLKIHGNLAAADESSGEDLRKLVTRSQEDIEKVRKDAAERVSVLENDLNKARLDASAARQERDRLIVEATYAREQLQSIVKESENQRKEMDAVLGRNVEFSQIITDYQRRLRENAEHVQSVEEKSRRLSVEVSVLEREKELISIAEKRASQELSSLSDRVHRLQATLDSIDTVKEAQESMRSAEKRKLEDEVHRMQKEWVEMKHELDSERAHTRHLSHERDLVVKQTMDRIQSISKDLADALQKVSAAETRAQLAEAHCMQLEASLKKADEKILVLSSQRMLSKSSKDVELEPNSEVVSTSEQLEQAREEVDRLKEELDASKNHIDQYKRLAQHNEEALLQMQDAHNQFKEESEKTKEHLASELTSIKEKVADLEKQLNDKESELAISITQREHALTSAEKEIILLREAESAKRTLLEQAEERIKALKGELAKEHQQWRTAQNNYERQVMLQADTIRELAVVSERNAYLEKEVSELRGKGELSMTELASSRVAWEMEKASLQSEKESLACKFKELQEQNQILLDQVEGTHRAATEHDKSPDDHMKAPENTGNDLQDVIRYLRRSKETSDMEISLLKQERSRLQRQLESALHAADEAQSNLRREHESSRLTLCSEEEFKSLQAQVREMTLLRESNEQLRLENKRNFEECQSLHEKLQRGQEEVESLRKLLREREVELEVTVKNVDLQKAEVSRWENRVSQLIQKYKTIDVEDYQRIQLELATSQEASRLHQAEVDASREELQKLQEVIRSAKQESSHKSERITELEKKIKDLEASMQASVKAETAEKYRKQAMFFKRKAEILTKEKDDTKDSFSKQLDELRANANKRVGEPHRSETQIRQEIASQHEQAQKENDNLLKEKETRIQTLERALEREREELKKDREALRAEKTRRQKDQKAYMDAVARLDNDKQKLMEELTVLKREKESFSENVQGRKFGRKIVRPKIESPVEPQTQLETNDMGNEISIEAIEVETEARDDAKLTSSEALENVSTTSAIVVAATFNSTSVGDGAPSLRKRLSAQAPGLGDEPSAGLSSSSEAVPAHKRQKGLECDIVTMAPPVIVDTLVTVEASKGFEMEAEPAAAVDLTTSDRGDMSISDTAAENQMTDFVESNQGIRPQAVQKEQIASKRPRIVRSDSLLVSSPAERDEMAISMENEMVPSTEGEQVPENMLTEERDLQYTAPVEENMDRDLQAPLSSPYRTQDISESTEPSSLDIPSVAASLPPLQETFLPSDMEETENLVIVLTDAPQTSAAPVSVVTSSEPGVPVTVSAVEGTSETGTLASTALVTNSGLDVEDGEIEPDDPNESNAESISQRMSADVLDEGKNSGNISLDGNEKDAEQLDDLPGDEKQSLGSEPPAHSDASENLPMNQKLEEMHGEKGPSQIITRQAGRGLSLEKARERISKRTGSLPPSPGRRGRGGRRTVGLQRGRINPPAVEPEDEQAKQEVSQPNESQSEAPADNLDTAREE